jgi:ABC-type branched-subunit amino acid transport system ATPase component
MDDAAANSAGSIELRSVNSFYGQSHVLHDVRLSLRPGERVAILGRNGAGKTTLLKSILNAGPRVAGEIVFEGRMLGDMPVFQRARLGIALVPEDRRILNHLTVLENIAMSRFSCGPARAAIDPGEMVRKFPMLEPLQRRYGGQLSGGQQQVLATARAVAARPSLLLLDEPTEGLAPVIVEQLARDLVDVCQRSGNSLLLSEQNIWFARRCTTRLYVLETGRIVFDGDWPTFDADESIKGRHLTV